MEYDVIQFFFWSFSSISEMQYNSSPSPCTKRQYILRFIYIFFLFEHDRILLFFPLNFLFFISVRPITDLSRCLLVIKRLKKCNVSILYSMSSLLFVSPPLTKYVAKLCCSVSPHTLFTIVVKWYLGEEISRKRIYPWLYRGTFRSPINIGEH